MIVSIFVYVLSCWLKNFLRRLNLLFCWPIFRPIPFARYLSYSFFVSLKFPYFYFKVVEQLLALQTKEILSRLMGNTKPTAPGNHGFFYPAGQSQKDAPARICQPGHKCLTDLLAQELCESETWSDLTKQWKICVEEYYCDRKDAEVNPISGYTKYPRPNGFY